MGRISLITLLLVFAFTAEAQLVFEEQQFFKTDIKPNHMGIGDVDGDLKDDILIASEDESFITVLLKSKNYAPKNIPVGEKAPRRGIAWGDFNKDGKTDLAVTDFSRDRIAVLNGTGNGEFATGVFHTAGKRPVDISALDFDNDSDLDLVTADNEAATVTVLVNQGGNFPTRIVKAVGNGPETVEAVDLNNDTFIDLVVVNTLSNSITVLRGNGSGSFDAANYTVGALPTEVQIADLNSDNRKDIAVVHDGQKLLSIFYGTSSGTFGAPVTVQTSLNTSDGIFAISDLNNDTSRDIAICSKTTRQVILLLNDGLGNFTESIVDGVGGAGFAMLNDVIAADLFNDGHPGLVLSNTGSIQVIAIAGDGTGNFNSYRDLNTSPAPFRMTFNDFNNDGHPDVAVANFFNDFITMFTNDTKRGLVQSANLNSPNTHSIASADIDADGYMDIIAGGFYHVKIFYGKSSHQYDQFVQYDFMWSGDMSIDDVNKDGKLDITTITGTYLGNGSRGFNLSHSLSVSLTPNGVVVCDLNNDGHLDKLVTNLQGDNVDLFAGAGNGTFAAPVTIAVGDGPNGITAGFFNADQAIDVAITNSIGGTVSLILGGTGTLAESSSFAAGNFPDIINTADFNNDGKSDLLVVNEKLSLFLGDGGGSFSEQILPTTFNPQDALPVNFDGHGGLDVLVASNSVNGGTGGISLHLSNIEPLTGATNMTFTGVTDNSVTINWTKGTGEERIVIARKTLAVGGLPVDHTAYQANGKFGDGSQIGIGNFVVYKGSGSSATVTGLTKGSRYHFAVVEFNANSNNTLVNYKTEAASILRGDVMTIVAEPTTASSNLSFVPDYVAKSTNVKWTNGNGDSRVVLAKKGAPVDKLPSDNTSYIANAAFGSGTDLGGGSFVLYDGTASSLIIQNLEPGAEYHYAVFEYNSNEDRSIINYLTSAFLKGPGPIILGAHNEVQLGISLFPNPTSGKVTISGAGLEGTIVSYIVTDITGKVLYRNWGSHPGEFEIELTGFPQGFYFVSIDAANVHYVGKVSKL